MTRPGPTTGLAAVALAGLVALAVPGLAPGVAGAETTLGQSGLPLPRFVSLKSDRVNLRSGPGTDYPTAWVFRRAGVPLEVIKEFEGWRQVRDADGANGWVLQSFLSGRRTALVLPWDIKQGAARPRIDLRSSDSDRSATVVLVEAGVVADLVSCDGLWCRVTIDNHKGYLQQKALWGVYEGEIIR